jgi:hypothetical protein
MAPLAPSLCWFRAVMTACGLIAVTCCSFRLAKAEEKTFLLRYKFHAGQFLYYEVSHTMRIVTQYESAKEEVANSSQAWKQLRVVSVDDAGNALLEPMVERVRMSAVRDGEEAADYDSARDADPPPQFRQIKETVGTVMARVSVAPNGELLQAIPVAQNNAALVEAAKKNDPRLNFLTVMPKTPVRIGDTWKDTFPAEVTVDKGLKQEVTIHRTYKLMSVNGAIATIKLNSSPVPRPDDPQLLVQLMQRTPTGTIEFDLDKGMVVSTKTQIDETVYNPFGPKSSMSAQTRSIEKMLPGRPEFKTVSRATKPAE